MAIMDTGPAKERETILSKISLMEDRLSTVHAKLDNLIHRNPVDNEKSGEGRTQFDNVFDEIIDRLESHTKRIQDALEKINDMSDKVQ